jgi:predicted DNA-binding antitoxin AbrB/MazE fold protein
MIKLKVRVISEKTKAPIKGARVLICENDKKIFTEALTNHDGVVKTRTYLDNDTRIFITVRDYNNIVTDSKIIGPGKDLDIDVVINEDVRDTNDSILQYFRKSIKEKYDRFHRR